MTFDLVSFIFGIYLGGFLLGLATVMAGSDEAKEIDQRKFVIQVMLLTVFWPILVLVWMQAKLSGEEK